MLLTPEDRVRAQGSYVGFVVDTVALGQALLQVHLFTAVSICTVQTMIHMCAILAM